MKKVLYGVFMAFFAVMTMGSLQSCTDDLDNLQHQTAVNFQNLDGDITALKAEVAQNKAECESEIARLEAKIAANEGNIDELKGDVAELKNEVANRVTYEELENDLQNLDESLKAYSDQQDEALKTELKSEVENAIAVVNARIGQLDEENQAKFTDVYNKLNQANGDITDLQVQLANVLVDLTNKQEVLDALQRELSGLQTTVGSIQNEVDNQLDLITDLQRQYDAVEQDLSSINNEIGNIYQEIQGVTQMISMVLNVVNAADQDLQDQIDALQLQLNVLQDDFESFVERVKAQITSIAIQATDSPVFGSYSLPLGIQSNVLFNWFFENLGESYTFPNAYPLYAYDAAQIQAGGKMAVSAEDVATAIASKNSTFTVPEGYADVYLGDLYLTINPISNQYDILSGKTFYLETSKGEEGRLPFTLDLEPSDNELMFGYTRSTTNYNNGFYSSEVVVPNDAESVAAVKVDMESSLKEAGQAVVSERSKRSVLNFLQAAYDQLNSSFPRYAVRAEWASDKASRETMSVLSQYDLAVSTAKPLSYKFLDGEGTSHRLPTFGHIQNLINRIKNSGKLNFELDAADYPVTITLSAPEDAADLSTVTIEVKDADGNPIGSADADSMKELAEAINNAIKDAFDSANADLNAQIQEQIENIIDKINSQINGKIDSVLSKVESKGAAWFQRLDKLIDLYNQIATHINAFLAEPNEYLQPAMFYKTSDSLGIVSMAENDPTVFENGGGEAFVLYPTSYTAELVAPAYKKMVACINVIDNNTKAYVSNGRELAKQFNATSEGLAVVLEGSTYGITVPGSALKSGYTYEIMYQGLDYSGVTSTRKFYIKVK